jgi:DNA-binding CsgD family transcriptional regulator
MNKLLAMKEGKNINLMNHSETNVHEIIKKICSPLFNLFKMTSFRYLRVYPDKSKINLCTDPHWSTFFDTNDFYNTWNVFDPNKIKTPKNREIIWDIKSCMDKTKDRPGKISSFNPCHGMTIIRTQPTYFELYDLVAHENHSKINYLYLENIDLFERFIFYFKDQAKNIIQKCEKDRAQYNHFPENKKGSDKTISIFDMQIRSEFVQLTNTNRFYINTCNGDTYLTKKEMQCIYWVLMGKSAEEISLILNCSKRTVEIHLNNIKQKLGVAKITQATKSIIDSGLMSAFVSA